MNDLDIKKMLLEQLMQHMDESDSARFGAGKSDKDPLSMSDEDDEDEHGPDAVTILLKKGSSDQGG